MELYIIALKELGLNNTILRLLIEALSIEEFDSIFNGSFIEIQYKHNIDLKKYSKMLSDEISLKNALDNANRVIEENKKYKIKHILINNKNYPNNLKNIEDAPVILYYKGRGFYKKHEKSVACVGTRKATDFTYNAINVLVPKLVEEDFTIVSGLALGTDTYSHETCLANNGTTIAVLAHGLDNIYPNENIKLAERILENNGLLVSEYPIGTKADKFRFVQRNRIVTGLTKSTIVFETKEKSGTMHSVEYAINQNKNIYCPLPSTITELTEPLQNLISKGIAKALTYTSSYAHIVYDSGYKVKKDKKSANKYISNILSNNVNNTNIDSNLIFEYINKPKPEISKNISFSVDEDLHKQISEYAKSHNITKKDLFNAFAIALVTSKK